MTERAYVSWVQPIAERYEAQRNEVVRVARQIPEELWGMPSAVAGWSYRDVLAHLAGSQNLLKVLQAVTEDRPVDPGIFAELDEQNARQVAERKDWGVDAIIAEIERVRDEALPLFERLREEDGDRRQDDFPMTLREGLSQFSHDETHLADLRPALDNVML